MARYDNRTVSDDQHSFYVLDDLRFQKNPNRMNRGSFDIFYYDTLPEAMAKLKTLPDDMTPALGMHRDQMSELDLIHRRNGEYVLVTDYQNYSSWRTDPVVNASVDTLCAQLNVDWQAQILAARITGLTNHTRKPCLSDRIQDANNRSCTNPHIGLSKEQTR